ncbi:MAG TPA: GIDE domain-containing protein [Polyangiaceae bacterium]
MGAFEVTFWGAASAAVAAGFAFAGARRMKRARLVERTPTTPAASLEGGEVVEIKGRVVAAEQTLLAPISRRAAVWMHVKVVEAQGSSTSTLLDEARAVEFFIDDGSGRMARAVPEATADAVFALDAEKRWDNEDQGSREHVVALLEANDKKGFELTHLSWTERALYVGDPVYVLGRAEAGVGPPVVAGYRTTPSSQLVLRGTREAPLTIAAMTEEQYLRKLKSGAATYFGCAMVVAVLGVIATVFASSCTTVVD